MSDVAHEIATLPERYQDVTVRGLAFSPDSTRIAVNAPEEELDVWNWQAGKVVKTLQLPRGFNWGQAANPIQYSPDGRLLSVCEGRDAGEVVIRLWDTEDWSIAKHVVDTEPGGCQSAAFTPNGRLLLYVVDRGKSDELVAYATDTWSLEWRVQFDASPEALAVSPDGRFVAVSGLTIVVERSAPTDLRYKQTVDLVDVPDRRLVKTFHGDSRGAIAWSADSARIAVAGQGYVEIFDVHSGERVVHPRVSESSHMNLRFTPDGRYLIESDSNGRGTGLGVSIWDGQRTRLLQKIPGDSTGIAVSKDGKYLAVGGTGRTTIWQIQ